MFNKWLVFFLIIVIDAIKAQEVMQMQSEKNNDNKIRDLTYKENDNNLPPMFYKIQYDYQELNWPSICKKGKKQSPINLPLDKWKLNLENVMSIVKIDYNISAIVDAGVNLQNETTIDDKTNSSFMYLNASKIGSIEIEKKNFKYKYDLSHVQFVFPPEHKLGDSLSDLEMQMVHIKNISFNNDSDRPDKDPTFKKLIISVLFDALNPDDDMNIQNLRVSSLGTIKDFNFTKYPPLHQGFLFYEGSLTKPPCTEDVNWIVNIKKEVMSKEQLQHFASWFIDSGYSTKGNSRKTQNTNGRIVYYGSTPEYTDYDSCKYMKTIFIFVIAVYLIFI